MNHEDHGIVFIDCGVLPTLHDCWDIVVMIRVCAGSQAGCEELDCLFCSAIRVHEGSPDDLSCQGVSERASDCIRGARDPPGCPWSLHHAKEGSCCAAIHTCNVSQYAADESVKECCRGDYVDCGLHGGSCGSMPCPHGSETLCPHPKCFGA